MMRSFVALTLIGVSAALGCGSSDESDGRGGAAGSAKGGTAGVGATNSGGTANGGTSNGGTGNGGAGNGGAGNGGTNSGGVAGSTESVRFAVIGDYGADSSAEQSVATMVAGWNPDFVITTGDNNYPDGEASTIDTNIGKYYHQFIGNYQGSYDPGSATNRFWPSTGNHDWHAPNLAPYLDYFTLPGKERYYEVDLQLVHLFAIDSDGNEPDGTSSSSTQGKWLESALGASSACWDIVYFHHPPYSSGQHGSSTYMRWPFASWGADVVFNGHDHTYERLEADGFPYFVVGFSGASLYDFTNVIPESQARYNASHGAVLVTATKSSLLIEAYSDDSQKQDSSTLSKACP